MGSPDRELLQVVGEVATQLRRVAYAIESTMPDFTPFKQDPCRACGCSLVPRKAEKCPVCGGTIATKGEPNVDGG